MRYIDVLTAAATSRSIESYESTLELNVTSSRGVPCFDTSLKLRDHVVSTLRTVGLSESDIHEGGGDVAFHSWAATKSVSHRIILRNTEMAMLMQGMAAVEQLFATKYRPSFFSPIKQTFTFQPPKPVYAPSVSAEDVLANAMQRAQATAEAIATAHGETIEALISVFEISVASQRNLDGHDEMDIGFERTFDLCDSIESVVSDSYTVLGEPKGRGTRRFRVRFSLKPNDAA